MKLSAIVTLYNRTDLLPRVLEGLAHQTLDSDLFEVIVVDDGSTDNPKPIIDSFQSEMPIRYMYQENAGLAAARNVGLREAKGDVVLFLDDDDMLLPDSLYQHWRMHDENPAPEIAVLGYTELLPEIRKEPLMHFVTDICEYLFSYQGLHGGERLGFGYFWGGRTSCKRQFALDAGGFNPVFRFGCEDIELGYRLSKRGLQVIYNPLAITVMIRSISFDSFCNRLRKQGASQVEFSRMWPEPEALTWCQISDFEKDWPKVAPFVSDHVQRSRGLDRWVRTCLAEGVQPDSVAMDLLFDSYRQTFRACKLEGMAKSGANAGL